MTPSKLKLKPIKSDNNQLMLLMEGHSEQMDRTSGIYRNYELFCDLIQDFLNDNPDMDVSNIYDGLEHLTCAEIKLDDDDDNAQEIFERINSTGVPLSLSDKIRNFVLMTDTDQDRLYEDYWLKSEQMLTRDQLEGFFLDYLNFKMDGFTKESTAYDDFKPNIYLSLLIRIIYSAYRASSRKEVSPTLFPGDLLSLFQQPFKISAT